jgi:translation initiation factor RLI1
MVNLPLSVAWRSSLLNEKECLFLLDEPEVHFNDDWKRNLVDSIERALTLPEKTDSEVILTTHASIVLTDAFSDEVILMTYAGQQIPPRTLGGEPGELLQSVLGASQTIGKRAIRKIQKALETKDKATLEAMLKQVGPGYYRFAIIEELQDVSPPEKD